jgi:hypothetical protein
MTIEKIINGLGETRYRIDYGDRVEITDKMPGDYADVGEVSQNTEVSNKPFLKPFKIDGKVFHKILKYTEDGEKSFNGIHINVKTKEIVLTDGFRLITFKVEEIATKATESYFTENVTISFKELHKLDKCIDVLFFKKQDVIYANATPLKVIKNSYPNYEQVIPGDNPEAEFSVNYNLLKDLIPNDSNVVKISFYGKDKALKIEGLENSIQVLMPIGEK